MDVSTRENDKEIIILRHSRKSFLLEYICSFFLLSLVAYSLFNGVTLPKPFFYPFLGIGVAGLLSTELRRYFGDRYRIMNTKLTMINGVFKVKKRNIYYQPLGFIPDLNIKQTAIQRLFNFGTIYLQVGSSTLEFRDVDKPNEVLRMLEELIEKTKHSRTNMMNLPTKNKEQEENL